MPEAEWKWPGLRCLAWLLVLPFLLLAAVPAARACTCMAPAPDVAFERASAVFAGKVAAIDRPLLDRLGLTKSGLHLVRFEVSRRWKGRPGKTEIVRTRLSDEACGYDFRAGLSYLVYIVDGADPVSGLCTGTKEIGMAAEDIKALGAPAGRAEGVK